MTQHNRCSLYLSDFLHNVCFDPKAFIGMLEPKIAKENRKTPVDSSKPWIRLSDGELSISFRVSNIKCAHSKLKICSCAVTAITYLNSSSISSSPPKQLLAMVWEQSITLGNLCTLPGCCLVRSLDITCCQDNPRGGSRARAAESVGGPRKGARGRAGWERISMEKSNAHFGGDV